jgi:hypothetical protein
MARYFTGTDRLTTGATNHVPASGQFAAWVKQGGSGTRTLLYHSVATIEMDGSGNLRWIQRYSTTDMIHHVTSASIDAVISDRTAWWYFIFVQTSSGGGPSCWIGDASTPPTAVTVTKIQTESGTQRSSFSAITIGNTSSGTAAWEGRIGPCAWTPQSYNIFYDGLRPLAWVADFTYPLDGTGVYQTLAYAMDNTSPATDLGAADWGATADNADNGTLTGTTYYDDSPTAPSYVGKATLTPNGGAVSGGDEWTLTGGGTKHGALTDASDSTYLSATATGTRQQELTLGNLPSDLAEVLGFIVRWRWQIVAADDTMQVVPSLYLPSGGLTMSAQGVTSTVNDGPVSSRVAFFSDSGGAGWSSVTDLRLRLDATITQNMGGDSGRRVSVIECAVDLLYEKSAPAGQTTTPNFIATTGSVYNPTTARPAHQSTTPNLIAATGTVYNPTSANVAARTTTPNFISSSEQVFNPTTFSPFQATTPDFIAATSQVFEPTSTKVSQTTTPDLVAATGQVYEPTTTRTSPQSTSPNYLAAASVVYEPSTALSALDTSPDFIASNETVYSVSTTTVAARDTSPNYLAAGSVVYEPTTTGIPPDPDQETYPDFIAAASVVHEPTTTRTGNQDTVTDLIGPTAMIPALTTSNVAARSTSPAFIGATATVFEPVTANAAAQDTSPARIESQELILNHVIWKEGAVIGPGYPALFVEQQRRRSD